MKTSNQKYEPTQEDLKKQEELDELGMTAMCGTPFTQEEYEGRIQSVIDGSCFQKYLDRLMRKKEETLKKLASIEETEKMLRLRIAESASIKDNMEV